MNMNMNMNVIVFESVCVCVCVCVSALYFHDKVVSLSCVFCLLVV